MNYRHLYHAGNFADVLKHITLTGLILSLLRKDTPFCYLDTHAGTGYYDLLSVEAKKTNEQDTGICKLLHQANPPELVTVFLNQVEKLNQRFSTENSSALRYYPGSPYLVKLLMRSIDRSLLCELQPEQYELLKKSFPHDPQVAVHHLDGFLGLKAFLPPKERRGLVLIDPPYEKPDEFDRIIKMLPLALERWETGIYALWYPIKERTSTDTFLKKIAGVISRPILNIELNTYQQNTDHLNGSGMLIINPPWQFKEEITPVLSWLWNALSPLQQGGFHCDLLS